jgi:predicted DNA-binding WGR domain protein
VRDARQPEEILIETLVQFTDYIRFVSRDPAKNRNRFYLLSWQPTLDGNTALVCTWGRLGTQGRSRLICYANQPAAQDMVPRIIKRRLQRGYQVVAWQ